MNDIVLSRSDRDKLINSVVELFPDNQSADGLLKLRNFPRRRRPMFEEHPEKAWREVFAEFDDRTTSGTPHRELFEALEVGAVAGTPYRDILTETSGRYERNAVLQRLASKYLRRGPNRHDRP